MKRSLNDRDEEQECLFPPSLLPWKRFLVDSLINTEYLVVRIQHFSRKSSIPYFIVHRNATRVVHFFPKKFMMLPCPAFGPAPPPPPFLPPLPDEAVAVDDVGSCTLLVGWGGGSSSEKDSQVGSSRVTIAKFLISLGSESGDQSNCGILFREEKEGQGNRDGDATY